MRPPPPRSTLFPYTTLFRSLGLNPHQMELTIYNLLMERDVTLDDVVVPSGVPGVDLLPSNIDLDRKSTRLNSSHPSISYAVFCLKKKKQSHPYYAPSPVLSD